MKTEGVSSFQENRLTDRPKVRRRVVRRAKKGKNRSDKEEGRKGGGGFKPETIRYVQGNPGEREANYLSDSRRPACSEFKSSNRKTESKKKRNGSFLNMGKPAGEIEKQLARRKETRFFEVWPVTTRPFSLRERGRTQ